ncbi:cob(I)yrinic acid a,c-diamide adenosyltransferase [Parachitinimonas caeni]|uniref:Cobalamin adenosyltransferase n=1 Tax=Parachitinimonas caeni TaxID=3031301 RepID=A0ABT7DUK8_9NEIS|nr:cob(I)yrinic acid a,c-diamide adenosyltransferase [Parachitinimonas caeni]MDK2123659.1 cob(I)yrinic acid a,c-diamide adenosyltransferase [Parachitinimonas caeni]
MSHRLSKIVTRTGDQGTTGLGDGSRVSKTHPRIVALGDLDELNSQLGVVRAEALPLAIDQSLLRIQHDLFDLGGEIAVPGRRALREQQLLRLEAEVEQFNAELGPLREFILPGGCRAAAALHVARAICRRAERALQALSEQTPELEAGNLAGRYLNRLSDLLFVAARYSNRTCGQPDVLWQPGLNATAQES